MKKKYLEHQMLGQRVVFSIGPAKPAYYFVDWRIFTYRVPCYSRSI